MLGGGAGRYNKSDGVSASGNLLLDGNGRMFKSRVEKMKLASCCQNLE